MSSKVNNVILSVLLPIMFSNTCESIKCFDCSSVNNSACLDINLQQMHSIIPVVDCAKNLPDIISKQFFCRKITQTILDPSQTNAPEVRIRRSCGWVKHKRECYKADNADHLETVCQCFGDMCNAATSLQNVKVTVTGVVAALLVTVRSWRCT